MKGIYNLYIPVCGFLISIICNLVFFLKKRVKNKETEIFSRELIYSLIDSIVMIIIIYLALFKPDNIKILEFLNKIDYAMYILFSSNLFLYVYYVTSKEDEIKKNKLYNFFFWITTVLDAFLILLILFMKVDVHIDGNALYSDGMSLTIAIIGCVIYFSAIFIYLFVNIKKAITKKLTPLYILILFFILVIVLNQIDQSIVIISAVLAFVNLIMLFTIENPDIKMIEQLEVARITAEKANQAKSDFLSSMSHEIRTPLNAIVGFSQMIEDETDIESCKEDAKDIVMASQNLLEIVNGILDISKIEANKMEIVNKKYNLVSEMEKLSKLMISRIGEKPIELVTDFATDIPDIMYGDIGKIKQIVTNILTNAVKYTESGRIEFRIKCINKNEKCGLAISVSDTGRGIKEEKIDTLFTKFNRLDEDKNSTIEGTGLGLAITKSLVDMMGGKIIVQSKYGEGSIFVVYISQKIVEMDALMGIENKTKELNYDFSGYKILVVDDNKLNLKVAEKMLKCFNVEITLVESGFECIDLIKANEKYDLILLDDMMPKMKGTETLNKLKELPNFNIPIIALTANALSGIKEKYIQAGFNDYLGKPIEKEELVDLLSKYLIKKQSIKPHLSKTNIIQPTNKLNVNLNEKKILIVDDNKINIKVASHIMKPYNFIVDEAYSGIECIEKAKNNKYDLIFMDIMMPEMDGIQTLNNLKELPNFDIPVVALTADSLDGARKRFLDAGFNEYISKPLDKEILDEVINKFINTTNESAKLNIDYLKQNGIDVDKGIELLGSEEMYNEILKEFISTNQEKINKLNEFYNKLDMSNYAIEVHSLKSDSKYLGFNKLAEISYEHEMKSKANDIEYVKTHYKELIYELTNVVNIIEKIK